ncbi:MAG: RNA polymerase sigma factor [Armatimonadota bacterium]
MTTMDAAITECTADDEAMRLVAAGDSQALAMLFERHKTRLFGYLCHVTGDRSLAEDLLSDVFLRVYRARGTYRPGSGFAPWLYRIARNLAIGELRRRSTFRKVWDRLVREARTAPTDPWEPFRGEVKEQVQAALSLLPEEQRSALVLKEYADLSYREVAEVLGCTEEAARARAYRARMSLRESLREYVDA